MSKEFAKAEGKRVSVTNTQRKQIKKMYADVLDDISSRIKFLENRTNVSSMLRLQYLRELQSQISDNMETISKQLEGVIQHNMLSVADSVVQNNADLLKKFGYSEPLTKTAFMYVPQDVVNEVMSGKLYQDKWSLSKAIWKDNALINKDLETIIAKGIAENKSAYDIAKDLEKYVNPSAKKAWDWSKVYPGTRKVIDYNAQRLARTMVSHAYEESFVRTTKNNPFIDSYKWVISNSDRVCPLCISRAQDDQYGLGAGIFPKDQLPLDHPNGMCTFETVITKSYQQIADDLANWVNNKGDQKLNASLDLFAKDVSNQPAKRQVTRNKEQVELRKAIPRQMKYLEQPFGYEELPDYVKGIGKDAYDKSVAALAKKYKMSVAEAQARMDEAFAAMVENSDFGMRINVDSLLKALESGSFKNQHQTSTSGGYFGPKMRLRKENVLFNVPKENVNGMTDADRPIYAILLPKYDGTDAVKQYYSNGPGSWYGDGITVIFRRENVINQSTLTIGDSFDYTSRVQAMLASQPKCTGSFNYKQVNTLLMNTDSKSKKSVTENMIQLTSGGKKQDQYIEAHLHGAQSHSTQNIEKIMLDKSKADMYGTLVDVLTKNEIPFEWI